MFIPIGLDQTTVRRLPWVSFALIAANVVVFLVLGGQVRNAEEEINKRGQEVMGYWALRPYLEFPQGIVPAAQRERLTTLAEAVRSLSGKAPASEEERLKEQLELDALVEKLHGALASHPFRAWGLVPANPRAITFLTSMFLHAGWLHLLGNMLFLYISGPFVEDAYGRPLFAALYLATGVLAGLVHVAAFRTSDVPLVGASGAIAGVMGAFLVRFLRTKIRFFYFYFVFLFRSGTVDLPAWIVLPLWFLQQVFFAGLSAESGVAYRAHVGGFVFGFVAALAIKYFRVEERFVAPGIEREISVTQHPALEQGMELLGRGETAGARDAFRKVLASEPRNADAHLGIWQSWCQDGKPGEGVVNVVRALDEELRRGETELALVHWREMVAATGQGGPGALRFHLATMLEPTNPEAATEVLRNLAADRSAGLLAEKAARRLATLAGGQPVTPAAAPIPVSAGTAVVMAPRVAVTKRPEPATDVFEVESEPETTEVKPVSLVFPEAPAQEATMPEAPDTGGHEVEECALDTVQEEGLMLRGTVGGPELLPFDEIENVCVAGIADAPRPYLVLDLVLRSSPGHRRTVERLMSSRFDPRHLIGRPDLPPLEAFRELVRVIAEASHSQVTPRTFFEPTAKIPTFASLEAYERDVLAGLL